MIFKSQLRRLIKEVLNELDLYSDDAVNLIQGVIAQESLGGYYLRQLVGGVAKGICQMEKETHDDIWVKFLNLRTEIAEKVILSSGVCEPNSEHLEYNLKYSIAMCRVHFLRFREPLPNTIKGYAEYWKKYYNTSKGKGTIEEFIRNYELYVK